MKESRDDRKICELTVSQLREIIREEINKNSYKEYTSRYITFNYDNYDYPNEIKWESK